MSDARYSYDIDEQSIGAYLKDLVDQVNSEQSADILSSSSYDQQAYVSVLKALAEVVNDNYDGDDVVVGSECDHNLIAEIIRRLNSKVTGQGVDQGDVPEWVPEGAVAFVDAVNERYWDGVSVTTLGDMIPGASRDGDGIITGPGGFDAAGNFLDVLAAWPLTVVVSANINVSVLNYETADPNAYAFLGMHNANATTDDFDSNYLQVVGLDNNQKIAATFSLGKLAISVEGAAVVSDSSTTLSMPTFTAVKIASAADDTGRISQIVVYSPAKLDADLPALATI